LQPHGDLARRRRRGCGVAQQVGLFAEVVGDGLLDLSTVSGPAAQGRTQQGRVRRR
jgi:hypothetical protein